MAAAKQTKRTVTKKTPPGGREPAPVKKPASPSAPPARDASARACPLVLDGEIAAQDFSPSACLTCDEFDCPFCEAAQGSGALRSRLFAAGDAEEDAGDDGWDEEEDTSVFSSGDDDEPDEDLF